jgi:hypothetical protein
MEQKNQVYYIGPLQVASNGTCELDKKKRKIDDSY